MCYMTQFVVALATEHIIACCLARIVMEGVLLKFGICAVIVIDSDNKCNDTFLAMVEYLIICVHVPAARGS